MSKGLVTFKPYQTARKSRSWRRATAPVWNSRVIRDIEALEDAIDLEAARIAEEEAERVGMIPRDVLYAELGL